MIDNRHTSTDRPAVLNKCFEYVRSIYSSPLFILFSSSSSSSLTLFYFSLSRLITNHLFLLFFFYDHFSLFYFILFYSILNLNAGGSFAIEDFVALSSFRANEKDTLDNLVKSPTVTSIAEVSNRTTR